MSIDNYALEISFLYTQGKFNYTNALHINYYNTLYKYITSCGSKLFLYMYIYSNIRTP